MLIDRQRVRDATTRRDIDAPILGMHSGDHYRPFQRCMPKDLADVIDRLEFRQIARAPMGAPDLPGLADREH